jgi:hypothetical protein
VDKKLPKKVLDLFRAVLNITGKRGRKGGWVILGSCNYMTKIVFLIMGLLYKDLLGVSSVQQ